MVKAKELVFIKGSSEFTAENIILTITNLALLVFLVLYNFVATWTNYSFLNLLFYVDLFLGYYLIILFLNLLFLMSSLICRLWKFFYLFSGIVETVILLTYWLFIFLIIGGIFTFIFVIIFFLLVFIWGFISCIICGFS